MVCEAAKWLAFGMPYSLGSYLEGRGFQEVGASAPTFMAAILGLQPLKLQGLKALFPTLIVGPKGPTS
jgi:hypothetical protein